MAEQSDDHAMVDIEVVYAKPERQVLLTLSVPKGTTLLQAVQLSGLLTLFPEIGQNHLKLGVFGVICPPEQFVNLGDRVEIYRPLLNDPKEARRQRALTKQNDVEKKP